VLRLLRRDQPDRLDPGTGTAARITVLSDVVRAESELALDRGPHALADLARRLAGATAAWLAVDGADVERAGPRAEDAVARSLARACREDRREQTRGDLVAVPGSTFALVLRFDGGVTDHGQLARATAGWVAHRLRERARDDSDERAARAELRALRAQISPHFTFNALGAIAAMMRFDPEGARTLLLEFADYTRYSFGRHGDYTTLAEELKAVETYLALQRARFGDRLRVQVLIPPELLSVPVPFLVLQPLVENAVRHGIEPTAEGGTITVTAYDETTHLRVEVEDDGPGMDPALLEARLDAASAESERSGFGMRSVDERLRAVYGDEHGLVVETAVGAGTRAIVRIPKYRPEVHL
jgi:two-component system LytT family sensor kinase